MPDQLISKDKPKEKQKLTLYVPPGLHRQLKIRAAVEAESMSALAERALGFYLQHPEAVESLEAASCNTHRVYNCPECASSLVFRENGILTLGRHPTIVTDELTAEEIEELAVEEICEDFVSHSDSPGEGELVPC
ncbi:hypothetical protein [Rubidibacter lacunae]|nr:hypothetical protein [Rubidibacter lacunae]